MLVDHVLNNVLKALQLTHHELLDGAPLSFLGPHHIVLCGLKTTPDPYYTSVSMHERLHVFCPKEVQLISELDQRHLQISIIYQLSDLLVHRTVRVLRAIDKVFEGQEGTTRFLPPLLPFTRGSRLLDKQTLLLKNVLIVPKIQTSNRFRQPIQIEHEVDFCSYHIFP